MEEIVISIAAKVAEYLVAPVGRQLGYLFYYKGNIAELEDEVKKLDDAMRRVQERVVEAENQGDGIKENVHEWLTGANTISQEAEKFIEDEKKANKSCFKGLCPNLVSRYQFSRQAKKKALDVKKSHEDCRFQTISHRLPLPGAGSAPLQGYQAFKSRASALEDIMNALENDKINKIGVCGMGGVGKTTLVKQVAKLAEEAKLFDKVVMVTVSREPNLEDVQTVIADFLALKITEKGQVGKAQRQIEKLKKKKLLIILDDIWEKLDLEAVGIPHGDDHVKCKIVMTSRKLDVLSQDMDTQENFEIRILSNDEAWQLFQNTAGVIPEFDVQSVAREVAEKCGGLPIALVTVAKALKNKPLPFWEDALRQLRIPLKKDIRGVNENVYKSLELSYDSLEIEDAKSLFLLCGLMGYGDISMNDLFKHSLGLGLFQSINTLDESTNRLQVLVDCLKSSSLLLDIDKGEYVKMHDVVRDVARQLASSDPRWFVVIEATQSEIHESTRYIRLSLSHEGILDLGERFDRPKIQFLLLVNEGPLKIPDLLFNGMDKLKVLHLFQMEFSSLPSSLQSLANLRTLCLDCCTLGDVAGIGKLKKLEVLSFRGSNIVRLPREMAQLTCLRWLDLSKCGQLQVIPPDILSNLSQLQHLCMKPSCFTLSKDEEINEERNACLAELTHLSRLTTLNIALQDFELLPKDMVFDKLTRYKIFIGGEWDLDSPCETKRALKLDKANRSLHLLDGIGKLLMKTEELSLRELSGTKSVLYEFDKEDFLQLKHLDVRSSPQIQYIVDSRSPWVQEHALFPLLESLYLYDMISLEKVCPGPIPKGSFGNLKTLHVRECHGLKIFLSLTMATGFLHLEEIDISYCNVMQQIIAYERESEIREDGHARTTLQPFPKLRSLELWDLPELMNFSSKLETSSTSLTTNARLEGNRDIHTLFFNHQVSFPNLEKLELYGLPKLKEIWHHQLPLESFYNLQILDVYDCPCLLNLIPSYLIHRLNYLKTIEVDTCEALEHVFDLQGLDGNTRILPKLESLKLMTLPRLRSIISNEDKINDNVRCLFSHSTFMDFHNLKLLYIEGCENKVKDKGHVNTFAEGVVFFGEKVSFPNLEELRLYQFPKLKEIWHHQLPLYSFSNLQILYVSNCPCILNLIPCHLIQSFKNLKEIKVHDCEVLKHVFDLQGLDRNVEILPKLETLELRSLPRLRCVTYNDDKNDKDERYVHTPSEDGTVLFSGKVLFPNLEKLELNNFPKLKTIWHHQIPLESIYKSRILSVHRCPHLVNLVSSHLIQNFQNLKEIDVQYCGVLEHVFDHRGLNGDVGILPKLEILKLKQLPKLRLIICNEDKNDNMSYLLSPSIFKDFHHLKELHIIDCGMLLDEKVSFSSNLEVLVLQGLPNLKEIDVGIFQKLKILRLENLPKLRLIICNEDKNDSKRSHLSPSMFKDFHNLEELSIIDCGTKEQTHVYTSTNDVVLFNGEVLFPNHQLPLDSFFNLKVLKVKNCPHLLSLIPCHLIQSFHNLKEIEVSNCEVLKHVFNFQGLQRNIKILETLETLKLEGLPRLENDSLFSPSMPMNFHNLKYCGEEDKNGTYVNTPIGDGVLFGEKVLFPNLKELRLDNLPKLKEIWHHQLPFDSFSNLQILIVKNCPHLINLIPCHLRRSFLNLKEIKVSNCKVLKHIFDLEGLDRNIEILLKLETLKLKRLPNLKNDSLFSPSMPMNFHNLKQLSIKYCGKEDKYKGYVNTPIEDRALFGEKVSLSPNLEVLVLQGFPNLKEIDVGIFQKLKKLHLEHLPSLRHIICNEDKNDNKRNLLSPSMFKDFHNLEELHIIDCGMEEQRDVYTSTNDVELFNGKLSFLDGVCYEAFESRASTFNKIMDALRDGDIIRIGVWGMGGVGKTTLLKQVAQQAKQQKLFTRQVYIDASWTRDSDNLQQGFSNIRRTIANVLGLPLRHSFIKLKRLQKENILIILDDIWKEINLEEVGLIPSDDDDETKWKIVLSSRDGDLLCKDMGAQICFQVEHLLPQEAWSLFKKTAGDSVEENLQLRQVVEEYCEGIPIAILTIAKALKDETVAVWKNVLEEMRMSAPTNISGVGNKIYSCLQWSYTHLKGDEVKSLFLLCGMLGYDNISMDLLLQYCLGLHMFDHIDSLEQTTNKLLILVQILKASNLLFFNAEKKSIKMHDVVSDVARAIASKDPHPFIVREDVRFEEWSETDESKRCTFISLNCKLVPELPHELVCPKLQIFLLQRNNPSLNIPNTFFEGMKKLKVLDLSKMNFSALPSSLDSLANLRALRLDGCELVEIALIGKLTKLEVLSLVGSTIPQLPEEMAQLTNLRWLDLNDCEELEVIPRNMLSSLSRLECLCLKSSFTQWADEGESNASLSELNHLPHLTTLDIDVPNAELLPKDILFENLTRYTIFVGNLWCFERDCKTKRALKLEGVLHLGNGISKLLERSEELEFMEFSGAEYVLYPSDRESFVELKHLKVSRSNEIQYIIDSKDQQFLQHIAFPLLESLVLERLDNLEEVWHGPIPVGSFGNLTTLHVTYCRRLKFLFVLSTARGLSQLEEMKIEYCNVMQQIIACEREFEIKEDGHGGTNLQLFPKLRTLELKDLPQLINFTSGLETTSSTSLGTNAMAEGSFFNHQFSFPILEELTLIYLPKLKDKLFHQLRSCNLRMIRVSKCPYQLNLV